MSDTLREVLSNEYDRLDAEPAPETTTTETVEAAPEPTVTEAAPVEATTATDTPAPAETTTTGDRPRNPDGTFAKKAVTTTEAAKPDPATASITTPPPPAVETATTPEIDKGPKQLPSSMAPTSWRPMARERWAELPAEVRDEWSRREREMVSRLQRSGEAEKFHQAFTETIRPYEMLIRAAGSDPLRATANMMQTAAMLQMGTPQQKAEGLARAIQQYGVDVNLLAAALDNPSAAPQAPQQPQVDPRLLVRQEFDRLRNEHTAAQAKRWADDFTSKYEFGSDKRVRAMAAAIVESDAADGVETSPDDAYARACSAVPEIAKVLKQREAAKAAAESKAAAERARAAASPKSRPTAAPAAQPKGLRDVLEAEYDRLAAQ